MNIILNRLNNRHQNLLVNRLISVSIMSTYVSKLMKDGRLQLSKNYPDGIEIKNFPQIGGGFEVHINWPYSLGLNETQKAFLDQYGLKYPKSFGWYQIRFANLSKITLDPSEMFSRMDGLRPVVSVLRNLK